MLAYSWKITWKDSYQGVNINYLQGCLETINCSFVLVFLLYQYALIEKNGNEKKGFIKLGDSMCLSMFVCRILKADCTH